MQCKVCGSATTKSCGKCMRAHYCNREHQVQHWKEGHNAECISQNEQNKRAEKSKEMLTKHFGPAKQEAIINTGVRVSNELEKVCHKYIVEDDEWVVVPSPSPEEEAAAIHIQHERIMEMLKPLLRDAFNTKKKIVCDRVEEARNDTRIDA